MHYKELWVTDRPGKVEERDNHWILHQPAHYTSVAINRGSAPSAFHGSNIGVYRRLFGINSVITSIINQPGLYITEANYNDLSFHHKKNTTLHRHSNRSITFGK